MDPEASLVPNMSSKGLENSLVSNMGPGNSLLSKIDPKVAMLSTKVSEKSLVSTKASLLSNKFPRNSLVPYSLDSESEEDDSIADKELSVAPGVVNPYSADDSVAENLHYEFIARPAKSNKFSSLIKSDTQPAINHGAINMYPYQSFNHSDQVKTEDLTSFRDETPVDNKSTDADAVKLKERTGKRTRGRPKKKAKENKPDDIIKMKPQITEFNTNDFNEAFGSSMTVGDAADATEQMVPERSEDITKPEFKDSNALETDTKNSGGRKSVIVLLDNAHAAQSSPKSSCDEKTSSENANVRQSSSADVRLAHSSVKMEKASLDPSCWEVVETSGREHCAFIENLTGEPICDETKPHQAKNELIPGSGSFKLISCDADSQQTSSILHDKDEVRTAPSVEKKERFKLNIPKLRSRMPRMEHDYMDGELQNVQGYKVLETA